MSIKQQAQKNGIIWNDDLSDEMCYKMMTAKCFYCDYISNKSLNGIDRMDSMGSYEKNNTVSCCKNCNFIKGCLDPETFIKRCQHISKHFGGNGKINKDIWPDTKSSSYKVYLTRAANKDLEFALTKEQFTKFTTEKCYYCNKDVSKTHINGIDRKNNEIGYNMSNCASCCSQCNYMKGSLTVYEFIDTCKRVSEYNIKNNIVIPTLDGFHIRDRITKRIKHVVPIEKIVVTKQQPNKEKKVKEPVEEYVPKKRIYAKGKNLPEDCNIKGVDIPTYCYYVPASKMKGDAFLLY